MFWLCRPQQLSSSSFLCCADPNLKVQLSFRWVGSSRTDQRHGASLFSLGVFNANREEEGFSSLRQSLLSFSGLKVTLQT
jgi:hypothetical protein